MNRHLHVGLVGHVQAIADGRRRGAPVFMQLEANHAGIDLLVQGGRQRGVAFAQKSEVHREGVSRLQHAFDVPRPGRAGGGKGAGGRPGAAAQHGGDAAGQRLVNLLRADEMDVGINAASGDDGALTTDDLGAGADDDVHTRLHVRVAGLADGGNAAALQTDIGFDDAPIVEDQGVGHDAIHRAFRAHAL